jgi:penicillin-binding protein 2
MNSLTRSRRGALHLSAFIMGTSFVGLLARLWGLQIVQGGEYRRQSEMNRLETVYLVPLRGQIQDRAGRLFASNRPAYNLEVTSESVSSFQEMWKILAPIVELSEEELQKRFEKGRGFHRRYEPVVIIKDMSRETVARISAERFRLPGVRITSVPARDYPYGDLAAHVAGYTREISLEQLRLPEFASYRAGDTVGQVGLERAWERYLQGKRGKQRVVVNASGWRVGELASEREMIGNTIELTLDLELQVAAEELLREKTGAVVALDPVSGEVLAMASSPGYDPNLFSGEMSKDDWQHLNSQNRLRSRSLQGSYPPGSIFKPILAIGGLMDGFINPEDRVFCSGAYSFGGRAYRCWKKGGHGSVNLRQALKMSCDVYFYSLGQRMGIDRIHRIASAFGLGKVTNIGLREESPGLMPSRQWKRRAFRKKADQIWFPGETLSVSIGQGAVSVTPLQMARAYSALVNGGFLVQPRLVRRVVSRDGHVVQDLSTPEIASAVDAETQHFDIVREALVDVVNSPGGTGGQARLPNSSSMKAGGKTGTAQVVSLKNREGRSQYEDHAWFVGFAPASDPKIVVAVLIEHGGHGGATAAPVAGGVMSAFLSKSAIRERGVQ